MKAIIHLCAQPQSISGQDINLEGARSGVQGKREAPEFDPGLFSVQPRMRFL
jgi:hypothetical protein